MAAPVTAIIGLGREVGSALARRFDQAGHKLMVADGDAERLEKALSGVAEGTASHLGDLHTTLGLRNCLAATLEAHGRVDHVVCIPPIPDADTLEALDLERFDKTLAKTTRAAVLVMRIFSEQFRDQEELEPAEIVRIRQSGTITFVLNLSGQLSDSGKFSEAVTQASLLGVMRAGALELAAHAVRCNAISALRPRAEAAEPWIKTRTPLGRAALADEIAEAALYLSSSQSAIITGETITLDGGRSALSGIADN